MPLVLSMSKDEPERSWFDKLTTSGMVSISRTHHTTCSDRKRCLASGPDRLTNAEMMDTPPTLDTGRARAALDTVVGLSRVPGLQYLVVDRDQTLFEYAGGWADLAARRAMTNETAMMAYSMSKTITAAAVLQLVEAQKIALDGPIDRYLDSQPYGRDVTVRELLSHTSGIPNPIPLRWVHPVANHAAFQERLALSAVLQRYPRLSFAPGTRFAYSNIGYWLLGSIVECASGEAFTRYVQTHVLHRVGGRGQD